MSTGARFQFFRVDPADQSRMTSWTHHLSRLTGVPVAAEATDPVYLWHLAAGNHRVLARGARAYASIDLGWQHVEALLDERGELVPRMVRLESTRDYGWMLLFDGQPAVTCARWYSMERDRRDSLRSAREAFERLARDPRREPELVTPARERA
ncbi:MAG: hypothetical protein J0H23_02550 [Micrococcales bacterium]|nr:hypothetical protein [Micrococcales bacterium]OJX66443.1 MAG: hypothetical protein BGO94_06135 [Micrococcales bacterium 72-143]